MSYKIFNELICCCCFFLPLSYHLLPSAVLLFLAPTSSHSFLPCSHLTSLPIYTPVPTFLISSAAHILACFPQCQVCSFFVAMHFLLLSHLYLLAHQPTLSSHLGPSTAASHSPPWQAWTMCSLCLNQSNLKHSGGRSENSHAMNQFVMAYSSSSSRHTYESFWKLKAVTYFVI